MLGVVKSKSKQFFASKMCGGSKIYVVVKYKVNVVKDIRERGRPIPSKAQPIKSTIEILRGPLDR